MIRAAGGVLWRPSSDGVEVALVHRPRYDDWSLPKGKIRGGEHPLLAASREVREETGIEPILGPRLPTRHYHTPQGPKTVDYWAMRGYDGSFTATAEVDQCVWLPRAQARSRLAYPDDDHLLDALTLAAEADTLVLQVRHASAGNPEEWAGDDALRPLDGRGHNQAEALRRILPLFAPTRLLSVDNTRCLDTLTPLAADLNLPVEPEHAFEERHYANQPAAGLHRLRELARDSAVTVVCSQGTVIPHLVTTLAAQDDLSLSDVRAKKGSVWALFFRAGRLAAADYYPNLAGPGGRGE
jgi:8-oxo-dGTP pyrophosphatase MutT (NUDIX family)